MQKMCLAKSTTQSRVLQHCALIGVNQLNHFAVNQYHMICCFTFSWLSDIVVELFDVSSICGFLGRRLEFSSKNCTNVLLIFHMQCMSLK
jgi:hypothetical protein